MEASIIINGQNFNSFEEYKLAYIKSWEQHHPFLKADLDWVESDWNLRITNPELFL